jgi:hypothetical protein
MIGPGAINPGNQEYLENCGIGGIAGICEIRSFIGAQRNGSGPPTMKDIDEWLNRMAEKYRDYPAAHLRRHGINPIDEWYVFKDRNKEIE